MYNIIYKEIIYNNKKKVKKLIKKDIRYKQEVYRKIKISSEFNIWKFVLFYVLFRC